MQRRTILERGTLVGGAALAALAPRVAFGAGGDAPKLEGAWIGSTNAGPNFPPFQALYTFARGGTMVTSSSIDLMPHSLSTPGYGAWTRTTGRTFGFAFDAFVFDPQGNPSGVVKARATATLDTTGDNWSGKFKFDVFAPNGALVFSGGGTHQATRIRVTPL